MCLPSSGLSLQLVSDKQLHLHAWSNFGQICSNAVFPAFHAGKPSRDSGTSHEQQYVRQVIELHDKYLAYVSTCFANSSLFHKALKEAFEGFCNKNVAGSTSAELMANFCDNLLKKVGCQGFCLHQGFLVGTVIV
jgi:hypothetical protein